MTAMELPHTLTVERLSTSQTNANKEVYNPRPDIGSVPCFLQPNLDLETQGPTGGGFSKGSRCFIDFNANVKLKDRVTIEAKSYNVSGMREHGYGTWPHKVLTLEAI